MGLLPLTYARPRYISRDSFRSTRSALSNSETGDDSLKSRSSTPSQGIPDALSFDKIVNGGTCPPCTLRDFMNYLIYVERSAENLQFFLWYRDFTKRFHAATTPDIALATEWTQAMEDEVVLRIRKEAYQKKPSPVAASIFKGTDFEKPGVTFDQQSWDEKDPFATPPQTPQFPPSSGEDSYYNGSLTSSYRTQAGDVFTAASTRQPFTIQPFRDEINRVLATYLRDGAPRQLNLSDWEQKATVQALARTTHPSALRLPARAVEASLRRQAHPNFIRWSICNGNRPRVMFARALGATLIGAATVLAVVLTLGTVPRAYRALAAVGWVLGVATLVAAKKGMCVVLHGLHHRHLRPWELFTDEEEEGVEGEKRGGGGGGAGTMSSFDSFAVSNSYEDEPWVVRYRRRNLVRKIFDREVWIEEPALRQIQDTIFVQSLLGALLVSGVLAGIFVALPSPRLF